MKKRNDGLYNKTGIYGIVDKVNGMIYVGQTLMNFGDRRDSHFSLLRNGKHSCDMMQADFNLHGEENFDFIVLCECGSDDIDAKEADYIARYVESGSSYNKCSGGRVGYTGVSMSEHTKKLIGEKNRINGLGRKASDETKRKMSEARKGRKTGPVSDEARKKMSKSHSGEKSTLAKLTEDQVVEMRRLRREQNLTYSELVRRFGVTHQCASDICNYKRWKYAP